MTWSFDNFRRNFGLKRPPKIHVWIDGKREVVSEVARRQAAENMLHDPKLREEIVRRVGEKEARRRYPEAFEG